MLAATLIAITVMFLVLWFYGVFRTDESFVELSGGGGAVAGLVPVAAVQRGQRHSTAAGAIPNPAWLTAGPPQLTILYQTGMLYLWLYNPETRFLYRSTPVSAQQLVDTLNVIEAERVKVGLQIHRVDDGPIGRLPEPKVLAQLRAEPVVQRLMQASPTCTYYPEFESNPAPPMDALGRTSSGSPSCQPRSVRASSWIRVEEIPRALEPVN